MMKSGGGVGGKGVMIGGEKGLIVGVIRESDTVIEGWKVLGGGFVCV